ncbi:MAG: choice-of-anchor Q domain-containing protein [Nitrospirota bacterium]|jgi:predicted outer membrane repeat protein
MKRKIVCGVNRLAGVVVLLCTVAISAPADIITVTNTNDSGPGSLRNALAIANNGDTIQFAVTGTIGLTTGELVVDKSVTISGPGAANLAIDGNAQSRVFHITPGTAASISGVTIANGDASGDSGGGIYNDHAAVTLDNCTISGNSTQDGLGGGIYNYGIGGIAMLEITDSTLSGNSAAQGGAVFNNGSDSGHAIIGIISSTLVANSAGFAGAIFNYGEAGTVTLTIENSTVSDNSAQTYGGAIYNDGQSSGSAILATTISTFSGNSAGAFGGGIFNIGGTGSEATVNLANTILKTGSAGDNIVNAMGTVISLGYNLSNDNGGGYLSGPGDQINTDPMLGPLQDNGGATLTHELLPGSPAIDTGDPNFTPPPLYDQRGPGFDRVVNGRIDIGSFEVQGSTPSPTATPTATPTPTPCTSRCSPTPRPRPTPAPRP